MSLLFTGLQHKTINKHRNKGESGVRAVHYFVTVLWSGVITSSRGGGSTFHIQILNWTFMQIQSWFFLFLKCLKLCSGKNISIYVPCWPREGATAAEINRTALQQHGDSLSVSLYYREYCKCTKGAHSSAPYQLWLWEKYKKLYEIKHFFFGLVSTWHYLMNRTGTKKWYYSGFQLLILRNSWSSANKCSVIHTTFQLFFSQIQTVRGWSHGQG